MELVGQSVHLMHLQGIDKRAS